MTVTRWKPQWAADLGKTEDPVLGSFWARTAAGEMHLRGIEFWLAADELADASIDVLAVTPDGRFPPMYWAEQVMGSLPTAGTNNGLPIKTAPTTAEWAALLAALV